MSTIDERVVRAQRQRKEEQVVAAILHMVSPLGILALIPSGVVWAVSRSRSRFLCLQALQALLFQLTALALEMVTFVIFMVGFNYALFSGMVARTGITDPELTTNLTIAMVAGFAIVFFFQFAFPCWGVWAGIQVLRGRAFQYPLLGALAIRQTARQPFRVEPTPRPGPRLAPEDLGQNILGGIAHLFILAGMSVIVSPLIWAITRPRSRALSHDLLQASLFQLGTTALLGGAYFLIWGTMMLGGVAAIMGFPLPPEVVYGLSELARITFFPFSWMLLLAAIFLLAGLLAVMATIQTLRGYEFNYPILGQWLSEYLQ